MNSNKRNSFLFETLLSVETIIKTWYKNLKAEEMLNLRIKNCSFGKVKRFYLLSETVICLGKLFIQFIYNSAKRHCFQPSAVPTDSPIGTGTQSVAAVALHHAASPHHTCIGLMHDIVVMKAYRLMVCLIITESIMEV